MTVGTLVELRDLAVLAAVVVPIALSWRPGRASAGGWPIALGLLLLPVEGPSMVGPLAGATTEVSVPAAERGFPLPGGMEAGFGWELIAVGLFAWGARVAPAWR